MSDGPLYLIADVLKDLALAIRDTSMAHGIDWERIFGQTGGLVDTGSVALAIQEHTVETARLANAVEDLTALYAVVNHVQDVHADLLATHE